MSKSSGLEVISRGEDVIVRIPTTELLFARGSAELTAAMIEVLDRLIQPVRTQQCSVKVEGHTCNLPIASARYPSNWELSSDRARNIALYLVRQGGLSPDNFSFMGYADTRPLVPNASEGQRRRNRRVEIILHPHKPMSLSAATPAGPAAERAVSKLQVSIRPPAASIAPPKVKLLELYDRDHPPDQAGSLPAPVPASPVPEEVP